MLKCPTFLSLKKKALICGKSLCHNDFFLIIELPKVIANLQRFYILIFFSQGMPSSIHALDQTSKANLLTHMQIIYDLLKL